MRERGTGQEPSEAEPGLREGEMIDERAPALVRGTCNLGADVSVDAWSGEGCQASRDRCQQTYRDDRAEGGMS